MRNAIIKRARQLRNKETKTEKLLWGVLRSKQVCELKFRRQHPIGPYFADFACLKHKLIVEIDGGYHDFVAEADLRREAYLRRAGWALLRFSDQDVLDDPETVAIGIASHLKLPYKFRSRKKTGSGTEKQKGSKGPA
jgi:very-short-patch-repair endonuclease